VFLLPVGLKAAGRPWTAIRSSKCNLPVHPFIKMPVSSLDHLYMHLSTFIICLERRVCNVLKLTNVLPLIRTTTCSCRELETAINHIWSPGFVCRRPPPQLVRSISGNMELGRCKEKCIVLQESAAWQDAFECDVCKHQGADLYKCN